MFRNEKRMSSLRRGFRSVLLRGTRHARYSLSPTGSRTARAHHHLVAPATAPQELLPPLHGPGAPLLPRPGGGPPTVAGRRRRRAPRLPVPRDLASGPVCYLAHLRWVTPPSAGLAARVPAARFNPSPRPPPLPDGDRPAPRPLLQAGPNPAD